MARLTSFPVVVTLHSLFVSQGSHLRARFACALPSCSKTANTQPGRLVSRNRYLPLSWVAKQGGRASSNRYV
ncbi:hypothetical protein C8F01DRAFT_1098100 [Mycena amicta]|nr:hypothetical protein C8F01DRAFT_1098100 [Mycena amicta]